MDGTKRYQSTTSSRGDPVCLLANSVAIRALLTFVLSSDFENKFVCGEIMAYDDLKEYGTESQVKAAGKLRQQGKPYEVLDGDICYWKSGA